MTMEYQLGGLQQAQYAIPLEVHQLRPVTTPGQHISGVKAGYTSLCGSQLENMLFRHRFIMVAARRSTCYMSLHLRILSS